MNINIQYGFPGILVLLCLGCQKQKEPPQGSWIQGTELQQIKQIEKQFRGFDLAMIEIGYRYQELYWAGQDQNWEYAAYQVGKIRVAMENGLERRPKRAASAQNFLTVSLPKLEKTVVMQDKAQFNQRFQELTIFCNACHHSEKVPYFSVQIPKHIPSPIQK